MSESPQRYWSVLVISQWIKKKPNSGQINPALAVLVYSQQVGVGAMSSLWQERGKGLRNAETGVWCDW